MDKEHKHLFFYGNYCGSCYKIKPLIKEFEQTTKIYWIEDTSENQSLMEGLNIEYLPSMVVADKNNNIIELLSGGKAVENYIKQKIN